MGRPESPVELWSSRVAVIPGTNAIAFAREVRAPQNDVRDGLTGSQDDGGTSDCGRECDGSGGGGVSGRGGSRQAPALRPAIIQ
jgi:hypothetical protein